MSTSSTESAFRLGLPPHLDHLHADREAWAVLKQEMRRWLEPTVGKLTLVMTSKYYGNSKALESGVLDAAWVPPLVGHQMHRALDVDLVARCVRDGQSSNRCALVAHVDDVEASAAPAFWTLQNAVWADASSLTGFLSPLHELVLSGDVQISALALAHHRFGGSQSNAIKAVGRGEAKYTGVFVPPDASVGDEVAKDVVVVRLCRAVPAEALVQRRSDVDLADALASFAEHPKLHEMLNIDGWAAPLDNDKRHLDALDEFAQSLSMQSLSALSASA